MRKEPTHLQMVHLYYRHPPRGDYAAVLARAREILGNELEAPGPGATDKAFFIFHVDHPVQYSDGSVPAQTAIFTVNAQLLPEQAQKIVQQSRRCPNAEELLRGRVHERAVIEMMASALPPGERVTLFHGVLRAMIEVTAPDALVFMHTDQVVAPADYLAACDQPPIYRPGSLNVRFYNISNSAGDMIMDTRGLEDVGLHDLQCHFRELDPGAVSRVLYNTAVYIFENGPVIASGETVTGTTPDSRWRCRFEESLLEPTREILDLDPGPPYAAGRR